MRFNDPFSAKPVVGPDGFAPDAFVVSVPGGMSEGEAGAVAAVLIAWV